MSSVVRRAFVDDRGRVSVPDPSWTLDWWIGADDRWRVPAREVTVRRTHLGDVPVVRTAMRVPGGEAIQRVYGVAGPSPLLVVEIENDSPAPFVAALVVVGARRLTLDGAHVVVDGRPRLVTARAHPAGSRPRPAHRCSSRSRRAPRTRRRGRA